MARYLSTHQLFRLPPEVSIISSSEDPVHNRIDIHVAFQPSERICPHCGSHDCVVKDSGRDQTVRHLPAMGRSVFLIVHRRRFRCKICGASHYEPVNFIHDRLHMTKDLLVDICLRLTEMKTIRQIADDEMVTEDVVSDVLGIISFGPPQKLPRVLCADEFKGDSGLYNPDRRRWDTQCLLTNITDGSSGVLIDVLPYIKGETVTDYFMEHYTKQERSSVKYYSCDMSNGYISVGKKCFPDARICIDLFHVVKRINDAMGDIRIRVQDSLLESSQEAGRLAGLETDPERKQALVREKNAYHKDYVFLKHAQRILITKESEKEALWGTSMTRQRERLKRALAFSHDLLEMNDRLQEFHVISAMEQASIQRVEFTDWLARCVSSDVPEIRSAAGTLKHWRGLIQNTWSSPGVSNGVAEGINNRIKLYKRISYGSPDFETMRKRLLLICGPIHLDRTPAVTFRNKLIDGNGEIRF